MAWLLPPAIASATIAVSLIIPEVQLSSDPQGARLFGHFRAFLPPERFQEAQEKLSTSMFHPFWMGLISGLFAGITVNAVAAFGEELGRRGFLQKQLAPMGFWTSSLFIGLIWGIWHAPLVLRGHNYPQHPVAGVFMMTVFCMLLGPIFSYIRIRSKSVIAAAIAHGSLNATAALPLVTLKGGTDLTVGVTGLAGFIVLAAINIVLLAYYRFHREKFDYLSSQPMAF
jgi:membrane protease YdiL (CAAX protease family)